MNRPCIKLLQVCFHLPSVQVSAQNIFIKLSKESPSPDTGLKLNVTVEFSGD